MSITVFLPKDFPPGIPSNDPDNISNDLKIETFDSIGVVIEQDSTVNFLDGQDQVLGTALSLFGEATGVQVDYGATLLGGRGPDAIFARAITDNPSALDSVGLEVLYGGRIYGDEGLDPSTPSPDDPLINLIANDFVLGQASGGYVATGIRLIGAEAFRSTFIDGQSGDDQIQGIASNGSLLTTGIFLSEYSEIRGGADNDLMTASGSGTSLNGTYGIRNFGTIWGDSPGTVGGDPGNDFLQGTSDSTGAGVSIGIANEVRGDDDPSEPSIIMGPGDDTVQGIGRDYGILNDGEIILGPDEPTTFDDDIIIGTGKDAFSGFVSTDPDNKGLVKGGYGEDQFVGFGNQIFDGGVGDDIARFEFFLPEVDSLDVIEGVLDSIVISAGGSTAEYIDVELFQFGIDTQPIPLALLQQWA